MYYYTVLLGIIIAYQLQSKSRILTEGQVDNNTPALQETTVGADTDAALGLVYKTQVLTLSSDQRVQNGRIYIRLPSLAENNSIFSHKERLVDCIDLFTQSRVLAGLPGDNENKINLDFEVSALHKELEELLSITSTLYELTDANTADIAVQDNICSINLATFDPDTMKDHSDSCDNAYANIVHPAADERITEIRIKTYLVTLTQLITGLRSIFKDELNTLSQVNQVITRLITGAVPAFLKSTLGADMSQHCGAKHIQELQLNPCYATVMQLTCDFYMVQLRQEEYISHLVPINYQSFALEVPEQLFITMDNRVIDLANCVEDLQATGHKVVTEEGVVTCAVNKLHRDPCFSNLVGDAFNFEKIEANCEFVTPSQTVPILTPEGLLVSPHSQLSDNFPGITFGTIPALLSSSQPLIFNDSGLLLMEYIAPHIGADLLVTSRLSPEEKDRLRYLADFKYWVNYLNFIDTPLEKIIWLVSFLVIIWVLFTLSVIATCGQCRCRPQPKLKVKRKPRTAAANLNMLRIYTGRN